MRGVFWLMVSEATIYGCLALLPLGLGEAIHHGRSVWQRKAAHFMVRETERVRERESSSR
jgi:hypothetical protein